VPGFVAFVDRDAVIDEPSANGVFHLVDAIVERLAILDQRAKLAMSFRGHVNGLQLVHGSHASQLERIVFVGLAFDVAPLPGIFVGGTNKCLQAMADGQVIDPARGAASLHDDQIDLAFLEDSREIVSIGSRCEEFSLASFCIEKAAHRIELTEVKSENLHVLSVLEVWGGTNVTVVVCATQDHGSESPDFIRMAPTPNPGLTWILYPTGIVMILGIFKYLDSGFLRR
jgi:hypothetical protein